MAIVFGADITVDSPTVRYRWQGTPPGVKTDRDIEFARVPVKNGQRPLLLDITMPEKPAQPLPAIIWICGGGWRGMHRRGVATVAAWLAGRGFAIVGFDYRVSGEALAPAAVEDCKAVVRWLRVHGGRHGIDTTRVGVWGDSAGGHLAAMLGASAGTTELEGTGNDCPGTSAVDAVCAFYPITDLPTMPQKDWLLEWMGGRFNPDARKAWQLVSPLAHVKMGHKYPPHLVVHGTADDTVPYDQGARYVAALRSAGAEATMVTLPGVGHSGEVLYGAEEVKEIVAAFFERTLRRA